MYILKLLLWNLCPINIYRPGFHANITQESGIRLCDSKIQLDTSKYNERLNLIYTFKGPQCNEVDTKCSSSTDIRKVNNYGEFLKLVENKDINLGRFTIPQLIYFNVHGCLIRADRNLVLKNDISKEESVFWYHTKIISFITIVSYFLSTLYYSSNRRIQYAISTNVLILPLIILSYIKDGRSLLFISRDAQKPGSLTSPKSWLDSLFMTEYRFVRYLTISKALVLNGTLIQILAVDSVYYNGYFKKTFYNGFSGMDIGSGFFIAHCGASIASSTKTKSFGSIIKENSMILFLGLARFIFTSKLKYSVNVEEYGIHWNLFITLGIARMASELLIYNLTTKTVLILSILITLVYEIIIIKYDLVNTFQHIQRVDFLTANKEGLVSLPNAITSILLTYLITRFCLKYYRRGDVIITFLLHLKGIIFFFLFSWVLCKFGVRISRSLNNARYLFNTLLIGQLSQSSTLCFEIFAINEDYTICDVIGRNSLAVFLLANLLTGLVNTFLHPYLLPLPIMALIVYIYMHICFSVAARLDEWKNKHEKNN